MLSDRSKSILMQVAFKEASTFAKKIEEVPDVTATLFDQLVALHDKYNLSPDDGPTRKTGGSTVRRENVAKAQNDYTDAPHIVLADGVEYLDFRGLKDVGAIQAPNFPDFKIAANPNARGSSKWILRDGEPTPFAIENNLA